MRYTQTKKYSHASQLFRTSKINLTTTNSELVDSVQNSLDIEFNIRVVVVVGIPAVAVGSPVVVVGTLAVGGIPVVGGTLAVVGGSPVVGDSPVVEGNPVVGGIPVVGGTLAVVVGDSPYSVVHHYPKK